MSVVVSKLQFAILAQSSREMFVSTDGPSSHEFASQFGLAIFYMRKTPKTYQENRVQRKCLLNEPASDGLTRQKGEVMPASRRPAGMATT